MSEASAATFAEGTQSPGEDRFLKLKEVCDRVGVSRSQIYNLISKSSFPRGIQLGGNCVRWSNLAVSQWMDSCKGTVQ